MNIIKIINENPGINLTVSAGDLMEFGQSIVTQVSAPLFNDTI